MAALGVYYADGKTWLRRGQLAVGVSLYSCSERRAAPGPQRKPWSRRSMAPSKTRCTCPAKEACGSSSPPPPAAPGTLPYDVCRQQRGRGGGGAAEVAARVPPESPLHSDAGGFFSQKRSIRFGSLSVSILLKFWEVMGS
jgi:hypothetical protein